MRKLLQYKKNDNTRYVNKNKMQACNIKMQMLLKNVSREEIQERTSLNKPDINDFMSGTRTLPFEKISDLQKCLTLRSTI